MYQSSLNILLVLQNEHLQVSPFQAEICFLKYDKVVCDLHSTDREFQILTDKYLYECNPYVVILTDGTLRLSFCQVL